MSVRAGGWRRDRAGPHPSRVGEALPAGGSRPRLLVLDTSYAYEAMVERGLLSSVTCRDLDGFFQHVWSVHPFATLVTSEAWGQREGAPVQINVSARHSILEGRVGRFPALRRVPTLNFLLSQVDLIARLTGLIRRERISVIRAGDPLYTGLLGLILSRLTGVPLVVRVGGNHDKVYATTGRPLMSRLFRTRRVEQAVEHLVFRYADLVAGANTDNLQFALDNGARPERSTLFRYGNLIAPMHFTPPAERDGGEVLVREQGARRGQFLLYIGRLEPVKHPDHVVRILAAVRSRGHDVPALLVGDGSMREELQALACDLGVGAEVRLCGNRGQQWLSSVIPLAAVVLSPHTGRALSEVALGAVPIVAYDVDWQSEMIESGVTGELVPYGDLEAMVEATLRLLEDREYAAGLGRSVRARALEMMDPERLNEHERACYRSLLQGRA